MAVANANLDVLTAYGFLDTVVKSGEALQAGLREVAGRAEFSFDPLQED